MRLKEKGAGGVYWDRMRIVVSCKLHGLTFVIVFLINALPFHNSVRVKIIRQYRGKQQSISPQALPRFNRLDIDNFDNISKLRRPHIRQPACGAEPVRCWLQGAMNVFHCEVLYCATAASDAR